MINIFEDDIIKNFPKPVLKDFANTYKHADNFKCFFELNNKKYEGTIIEIRKRRNSKFIPTIIYLKFFEFDNSFVELLKNTLSSYGYSYSIDWTGNCITLLFQDYESMKFPINFFSDFCERFL
jgi:hypothetical protein